MRRCCPAVVDGTELLPSKRIALATEPQWPSKLSPGDPPPKYHLGYSMDAAFSPTAFGHNGYGGSTSFADPACGVAFGFARNRFDAAETLPQILDVLREAVKA